MRCSYLIAPVLLVLAVADSVSSAEPPALPTIPDEPKTVDPAAFVPPPLAERATQSFEESSLREMIAWLRDDRGIAVLLDNSGLDDVGITPSEPVSDRLDDSPIYLLLNRLRQLELVWWYEDETLTISSEEEALARLTTRSYNVGSLIDAGYEAETVIDVIVSTIASDTWAENGGGEAEIRALGDVLFVSQTDAVQRAVKALLTALGEHGRQTFVNDPIDHVALRAALDAPVSVDFDDTPLQEAVRTLAEKTGVDIRLDEVGLDDLGIRAREPVRLTIQDRKLQTVLWGLGRELELTWSLRDGVLWLTSEEAALTSLQVAVYDVRDLCRDDSESDALIDAIVSQTDADTWAENGGGEAEIRSPKPGVLVVSQQEQSHRRVLGLLEAYRDALRSTKPREKGPDPRAEVTTFYYRLHAEIAEDLKAALPSMVEPESWRVNGDPDAVGVVRMIRTEPEVRTAKSEMLVLPRAVLVIRQSGAVHEEIGEVIRRVERGDSTADPKRGGFGGGGGGSFGGGYF